MMSGAHPTVRRKGAVNSVKLFPPRRSDSAVEEREEIFQGRDFL